MSTAPRAIVSSRRGAATLACALLVVGASACGTAAIGSHLEERDVDAAMQAYGLDLAPSELPSVALGWQAPPPDCPHAYRLTVDHEPALRFEEDGTASLVLGRHPRQQPTRLRGRNPNGATEQERALEALRKPGTEEHATLGPGPIPPGVMVPAHLFYQGVRAERVGATRDVSFTAEFAGPAAPTAACMPRTWDPMEDALALGWPKLPGRLTAVGEAWNGLPVQGKCARSACVNPQTGGGGADEHARTCVIPPWHEQLAGLYEHEGELYAWIVSRWSDGHEAGQGIGTTRQTLVSVEHGRPVWSRTVIDHRFAQPVASGGFAPVVRTWTLEAIDACPGSLHAAGWERPPELADEEARLRERLAASDELRRNGVGEGDRNAWTPTGADGNREPTWPGTEPPSAPPRRAPE